MGNSRLKHSPEFNFTGRKRRMRFKIKLGARCLGLCLILLISAAGLGASSADLRLVDAVRNADKVAARALVKQGADVNARAGDGATALHWAAFQGDEETADLLIRKGARVNAANDLGVTPLWVACNTGNTAVITRLLKAGADPNIAPSTGGMPLMIAAREGNTEAVKLLLAHGADVNAKEGWRGQTPLMWAAAQQHPEVVRVLLEHRADVHARSRVWRDFVMTCCPTYNSDPEGETWIEQGGFTPLLFAARAGDVDSAKLLLGAGANVNDAAPSGPSVLVVAAHSGHRALVTFLLDHGADPEAAGAGYTSLHAAVLRGDLELVKVLLAHGANPNARLTKGTPARRAYGDFAFNKAWISETPFLLALELGQLNIARALAAGGADTRATMQDGTTPLMVATRRGEARFVNVPQDVGQRPITGTPDERERLTVEGVKLVLDLGKADVNAANDAGDTALHIAAAKRANTVIQFLVASGAKLDVKDNKGLTPLALVMMGNPLKSTNGIVLDLLAQDAAAVRDKTTADLLRKLGATQ